MRLTGVVSRPDDGPIRWGILSTGHIASVLTRDLALLPEEAVVVAVGSRSLDKAEQFAAEHDIPAPTDRTPSWLRTRKSR